MASLSNAFVLARKSFNGRLIGPYQSQGVTWMLNREINGGHVRGGFLCDEMGLGKTAQTAAMMLGNPVPRTLIIVPKSIVSQWVTELKRFAPHLRVYAYDGPARELKSIDSSDVVIAPYSVTTNRKTPEAGTPLHRYTWDRIILDEGHEIRNIKSRTHKSICNFRSSIRWILSGTPIFNTIKDFVALCAFLGIPQRQVQAYPDKIRASYLLRRTKEDVARFNKRLELPPCDFQNVELDMYPEERAVYNTAFMESKAAIDNIFRTSENIGAHNMEILECLLRVRQVMTHPQLYLTGTAAKTEIEADEFTALTRKFEYLHETVLSHPGEKSLIFCQFIQEMDLIQNMFEESENMFEIFRIDGSVPRDQRDLNLKKFRSSTSKNCVFLIQVKAGGVGLNIQEATRVYITSPSWNPATELQAIGRSHRTGQTQRVVVRKLIYSGDEDIPSVEQSIMVLQEHKSKLCAEILADDRLLKQIPVTNKKGVSLRDVKNIFRVKK
tara:strand:+ start:1168 stop:2655 length:1488 start_codon:yes stop_codon:yes gene_type:complete